MDNAVKLGVCPDIMRWACIFVIYGGFVRILTLSVKKLFSSAMLYLKKHNAHLKTEYAVILFLDRLLKIVTVECQKGLSAC